MDPVARNVDRVVAQLVEQARQVMHDQERLGVLLRAVETITSDLTLDTVLSSVVRAARDLTHARYAALGVIAHDRQSLARFIHDGFDEATIARVGRLPQGKGLLGALITDAEPIRLARLDQDPRSAGFPDGHPPMDSFLGVPVRVGSEIYGNLYLTDAADGEFTADDQALVTALAAAAGRAVNNARRFQESELQQRWLAASADITQQLLQESMDPLPTVAATALELADADLVTLGVLQDGNTISVEVALGSGAEELVGARFPLDAVVAGLAVERAGPMTFDATELPEHRTSTTARTVDAGPMLVAPLQSGRGPRGVLTLVRRRDRLPFSEAEVAMAGFFADHAAVALELREAREAERKLEVFEDRDRIARDLHDRVISELFALGLSLNTAAAVTDRAVGPDRLLQWSDDVDRTIRRIRTTIFGLREPVDAARDTLRQRLLDVCREMTPVLGFAPNLTFAGLVDNTPMDVWDDATSVAREALTNVAKHACATGVDVDVSAMSRELGVAVVDNGVGIATPSRSSGVANMAARARRHGGTCEIRQRTDGPGTRVTWAVPLTEASERT